MEAEMLLPTMRPPFSSLLLVILILANSRLVAAQARLNSSETPVRHISFSSFDRWTECVRSITGKPLLVGDFHPYPELICPTSLSDLQNQISGHGALIPGENWDLLLGKNRIPVETHPEVWRDVRVELTVGAWEHVEGSREPTAAEIKLLTPAALSAFRPSLGVVPPVEPDDAGSSKSRAFATAFIKLELLFDIRRLSEDGPESIIAVLREQQGGVADGRILFGEFRDGKPVFLWDSPRLTTRLLEIRYRDLYQDGTEEIMLMGFRPSRGVVGDLIIFRSDGTELTRQPCESDGFACEIPTGGGVSFVANERGGPDTLVVSMDENVASDINVYEFHGTYVRKSTHPSHSPAPDDSNNANDDAMRLMRAGKYEAAAEKFTEAVHLKPAGDARLANDVGFAYYKAGRFQDSVLWLLQAISLDPRRAIAYLNLGDAYAKLNRAAEARQAYAKYLELAPDSKSAPDVKKKLAALPPAP